MSESTISLPSLLILAGISFVLYRYIFGNGRSSPGSLSRTGPGRRIDPAAVNQVASMFPQLDRRAIAWDLQRNGGNAQATVERMLMTGRLETPPPSFQPQGLTPPAAAAPATSTTTLSSSAKPPIHPDLITRFNLGSRVTPEGNGNNDEVTPKNEGDEREAAAAVPKGKGKSTSWSTNKNERADLMRKRKEEMILQARRRMEEKDRRDAKGKAVEKS